VWYSRLEAKWLLLRYPWGKELYGSRPEVMQVEITNCSAVIATLRDCARGKRFLNIESLSIDCVSHISITNHPTAFLISCSPIHSVCHI
jgi:hypothetical protein